MLCTQKRLAKLPLAVRLTRAARPWLLSLIPCDVTDFVRRFSRLRHNVPLLFVSALLKERDAVTGMLGRLPNLNKVTAAQLQAALIGMLGSSALNRQGVASTCRIWRIVRTSAKASAKPRRLTSKQGAQRGLKRTASAVAATHSDAERTASAVAATHSDEYEVTSQLAKLIECTCPWPCTVIKDAASFKLCVARVKLLDEAISAACPAWGQDTVAYVHSFLRRKLTIGELCSTPVLERCVDWSDVSLQDLKMGSPDQD